MGLVDDLVGAVEGTGAEDARKEVVVGFLRGAGAVVEGLGPEVFREVMGGIVDGGGKGSVPAEVVAGLDEQQVLALLGEVDGAMDGEIAAHGEAMQARAAALEVLKNAALSVVAKVVVGMI